MTSGTTAILFKKALRDALTLREGLSDVQVTYAHPVDEVTGKDIWFGKIVAVTAIPVMKAGTKKVQEQFDLTCIVQVLETTGLGQEACDELAVEYFSEVQQQLAENPQIIPEIQSAQLTGWEHSLGVFDADNSKRGSRFELVITGKARLFP